ncbi:TonB-dependent receptor domain-containing protein [candidate division KSB1 bacterium]
MKKFLLFFIFINLLPFSPSPAQENCKIKGAVIDQLTGKPLTGVYIYLNDSSELKTLTGKNGRYELSGLSPGVYKLNAFFPGYKEYIKKNIRLKSSEVKNINILLQRSEIEVIFEEKIKKPAVVIPLVIEKEKIAGKRYITKEDIDILPGGNIKTAVSFLPGFVHNTFRGSREFGGETVFIVDGINMVNPIGEGTHTENTGAGQGNFRYGLATELPRISVEEIEVMTGGFDAEYGQAQSAVVNVTSKKGSTSKYSGEIRFESDAAYAFGNSNFYKPHLVPMYYGPNPVYSENNLPPSGVPDGQTVFLDKRGDPMLETDIYGTPVTAKNLFIPYQRRPESRSIEFYLSGREPFLSDWLKGILPGIFTFSLSGEYKHNDEGWRKRGFDYGYSTNNNITYQPSSNMKFTFSFLKQKRDWILYDTGSDFYLWPDGVTSGELFGFGNSGYPVLVPNYRSDDCDDHYVEIPVRNFELLNRLPVFNTFSSRYMLQMSHRLNQSTLYDVYFSLFSTGKNRFDRDPLTLKELPYDDGGRYGIDADRFKIYGSSVRGPGDFYLDSHPNDISRDIEHVKQKVLDFKTDFTRQIKDNSQFKTGIQLRYYDLYMENFQVASGGNDYTDYYHLFPLYGVLYFQGMFNFKNTVLKIGLRADYLDPNCKYSKALASGEGAAINPEFHDYKYIGDERRLGNPGNAKKRINISPRLSISKSISEKDILYFSYGHFIQYPSFDRYYSNHTLDLRGAFKYIGNPNLDAEKTVSYEAGFEHTFKNDLKLDITGYFKNVDNLIYMQEVRDQFGQNFSMYDNIDFAEIKGVEITLQKRFFSNWSFRANYTLQWAKGRYSESELPIIYFWSSEFYIPRTKMYFLNWDRRHTLNGYISYKTPENLLEFVGGGLGKHIFGDWLFTLVYKYRSGLPYSSPSRSRIPPVNDRRYPPVDIWDLKLRKEFNIVKNLKTYFYADIFNVFDGRDRLSFVDLEEFLKTGDSTKGAESTLVEHIWQPPRSMKVGMGIRF